jgi:pimeloyl-ACP methyl ester carboxylesterase
MRADHASLQSTDWSQGDTLGIIALFNEGEQTMGVQDHASTGKPRRRGLRIASGIIGAAALLAAGTLGTMRLGWWNPSYDEVVAEQATGPSRFEMVGPVKLHVRDEGQGPVILMLHSSMSNLRIWDGWADQLKKSYRVVRFDWPPYGMSVDPRASQGMPTVVDLIERFVAQKRLRNFVIVASSSGATIATMYTARHPEHVRALAVSTLPLKAPPPTQTSRLVSTMSWMHENLVPNYMPEVFYRHSLAELYGRPERLKPETVRWYYLTNNIPGGFARVKTYYLANTKSFWGAGEAAAAVKVPVLLQWGDRDIVIPKDRAEDARTMFANAPMTIIHYPDVGHYPMIELPERTGQDLRKWIDALSPVAAD